MTEFVTDGKDAGRKLDYAVERRFGPGNRNKLMRALRNRDVKINGQRVKENLTLDSGCCVTVYGDFEASPVHYCILFENEHIAVCEKPQGIPVQNDANNEQNLSDLINKEKDGTFRLCHRLDRNTGGIVIFAKDERAYELVSDMLDSTKKKSIIKKYNCLVAGKMPCKTSPVTLTNYLFKDDKKSLVYIYDEKVKGSVQCTLKYELTKYNEQKDFSELTVELVTGKTHQIRAQLSHAGHQILGDGKYGREEINKKFKYRYQALWAAETVIPFTEGVISNEDEHLLFDFPNASFVSLDGNLCLRIKSSPKYI